MTHSTGPVSIADWVLAGIALITVLAAFYYAIRFTLWPGEKSPDHIKRRILIDDEKDAS